jgi:hypothetical protein
VIQPGGVLRFLRFLFATATTSAAFFPHLEQRIRGASSVSVTFQPTRRASAWGGISRPGAAFAHHAHQKIAEAIVKPLDVSKHAHGRMVRSRGGRVHAVLRGIPYCMEALRLAVYFL